MKLPNSTAQYDQLDQNMMRNIIERDDLQNFKRNQDVEIRTRLILASPNGTRYQITVSNAGALVVTAL
tara:strand:- start:82 stop:285 length:204 start_codon:yes stop_codon:yes gene_type:complete